MERVFSEAAASICPNLGWNRTCVLAPCPRKTQRLENKSSSSERSHTRKFRGSCLYNTKAISSVDVPETNLIVAITRAEKLCFLRVKIKGHYRCSMTRNGSSEVTRLHSKIGSSSKSQQKTKKWLQLKETNYYTSKHPRF